MSDIINILPDSVANQIAAGEVVDRPASAVKELLENAMDAGATQIQLIVKDAGRTLLQVIDNGCGMSDTDARLCFERHATSKIHKADDLFAIHTMGFRGEALASIAAIAQVELKTRLHDRDLGTCIEIEGSQIKSQQPCNCAAGTSIAVKNLFFNVPARRNFLKKDTIELSHIEEVFKRIVIVHHDIAFSFFHNGKMLYDLKAGNLAQRLSNIYGTGFSEKLYPIDEQSDVVGIKGYVSKAEYAKKTRGEQYLFVNGRYIKHPALSAAVEKAYSDMIPDRFYPSYFLSLKVDPSKIDINIHPTKTEVKFLEEHAMFAILRAATKKALGQFSLATELEFDPSTEIDFSPAPAGYVPHQPQVHYNPNYNPFHSTGVKNALSTPVTKSASIEESSRWENFFEPTVEPHEQAPRQTEIPAESIQKAETSGICFQLQNHWIVTNIKSGLLLIDQQRAHERILYERLTDQTTPTAAQQLLFPINCTFSPADADMMNEILPDLEQNGFMISRLNKTTFVVSATPNDLKEADMQQLFDQLLTEYKSSMIQKFSDRNQTLCRTLSRQMAVKNGQTLQPNEMQQIIADLFCCKMPETSPSGQKTLVILKENDIKKLF